MSKTPYEVRLELLAMAKDILMEQVMTDRIRIENDWNLEREKASIALSQGKEDVVLPPFPNLPMFSSENVINMAKRLNEFVSNVGE